MKKESKPYRHGYYFSSRGDGGGEMVISDEVGDMVSKYESS
jgi:hypothetical protein